ncbi:hypothetical protein VIBNISOn1_1840024 [Vibrio nigripulchritudo SOn1]|uniref:Uncharacterized protein n=1 Tax=Vibrio nigripulchritudo SOn1 TaxID=1238450 RepID=A0AAV2VPP4_9VIBR|nr:hypothetical protein [Vibrio nigripulchritudo]CCO46641.1 hypothetical protein VIBNISOn1_1840024 [Vibrio nigripulchritudo SOn1]
MADKWLVERLTKSKQRSLQWIALAEALEELWDSSCFGEIQSFKNNRNIFTADDESLDKRIGELGDYFNTEIPIDISSKRLAVAWQRSDIHEKNTITPFLNSLYRSFTGLEIEWLPLYCEIGKPYIKSNLLTERGIEQNQGDVSQYWLTSRGKINVDVTHLRKFGLTREEFKTVVRREISRYRPTHIVYDGEQFILTIDFDYSPLSWEVYRSKSPLTVPFISSNLYLGFPHRNDPMTIEMSLSTNSNPNQYLEFDAVPADFAPLDTPLWSE